MSRRSLPRRLVPDDGEFLFEGDITDYWSPAVVRHWVLHLPGMKPTDYKLYMLLRAMLTSSPRGLRRMSVDELCWLLTEEGEKPVGESTVRAALKRLEKANLVTNPDGERIVTSTGKGGIQTISRRYKVHDLPPDEHVGWANTWQKLDAYRPDWRENPIVPPTHTKTSEGIVRSKMSGRTDLGEPHPIEAPKDETAGRFDRSISSSAQQKSSSRAQKSSGRKPLTSGNEGGIQAPIRSSLSPVPGAPAAPGDSAEEAVEEREIPAAPTNTTPVPGTGVGEGTVVAAAAVAEQFAILWKAKRGTRPNRRQVNAVAVDVAEAIADDDPVEWLTESVVPFMVGRGYLDLGRAKTHPQCPRSRRTKVPGQRAEHQSGHPAADCPDCYGSGWTDDLTSRCPCTDAQPAAS